MGSKSLTFGALVAAAVAASCSHTPSASSPPGGPRVLAVGPVTYFQAHCARCHGPYGSFYALPFKITDEAALKAKIDEMARGPGGSPLDAAGTAAQAAFHKSLAGGGVFLSVSEVKEGLFQGEVTLGAEVAVIGPSGRVAATVEGHRWRCQSERPAGHWTVEGRLGEKVVVVDPWIESFRCSR